MAYDERFCDDITEFVGKIAPILRLPGEEEMHALPRAFCGCSTGSRSQGYTEYSAEPAPPECG